MSTDGISLTRICAVLLILLGTLFAGGGSLTHEELVDLRPRILSYFTEVPEGFVRVIDSVDGDTIVVELDGKHEHVRLLGIDTPETKDPRRGVQCFGKEAAAATRSMIAGRAVKLLPDTKQGDRDSYGRLLRYVYFEDGTTVNERLVYDGYAFAYERFPTARLERLQQLEADAKKNQRGLWSACKVSVKNNGKTKSTQSLTDL